MFRESQFEEIEGEAHTGGRTKEGEEVRSAHNFGPHTTSVRTSLRSAHNFGPHTTSVRIQVQATYKFRPRTSSVRSQVDIEKARELAFLVLWFRIGMWLGFGPDH